MECKSSIRCECSGLDKVPPETRRRSLHLESTDRADIFNSWLEVVEEYSKLLLTRESDRLPALTGVATVSSRSWDAVTWPESGGMTLLEAFYGT